MEKSIAMENVSINFSSRVYRVSDVKGKCSGNKCLGISLAVVNILRLSYCLLSISLSDLVLSYENLTLTFAMNRRARSNTNPSSNILTQQRNFSCCPSSSIQVLNYHSVLGKGCRCPSKPGMVWMIRCNKLKQKVKALKLDCKVVQLIIFH